jgi:phospholipid/cholesterol/gamma-HCH transport system substrate-binding protein
MIALAGIVVISLSTAAYILVHQRLRMPWIDVYTIKIELTTAQSMQPGQGQSVQVSGVNVGEIKKLYLREGRPVIELEIESDKLESVHSDATAIIRPRTPLNDMTVQLNPGTKKAPELDDGDTIPISQTRTSVNVDEVLAGLDADTRQYLKILLVAGGSGLEGRADDLRKALEAAQPALARTDEITATLAQRRRGVRRLVHNLRELSGELGDHDGTLRTLVSTSNTTFGALAAEDDSIRASLRELPPTLASADRTLQRLRPFAAVTKSSLERLRPTVREAAPVLVGVRPLLRSAPGDLADVRAFTSEATPLVATLRPTVEDLRTATPAVQDVVKVGRYAVNELMYNPDAPHKSYLFWTAWFAHNLNSMLSVQDGIGTVWRGQVMVSCSALGGLRLALPLLAPLYALRVCPEGTPAP